MSLGDVSSRPAILKAIAEFDRLGREAFLDEHGFGRARRYFLKHGDCLYDSKAIVGVAHGYQFPDKGPLKSGEFNGGERTVQEKLEDLGFAVTVLPRISSAQASPVPNVALLPSGDLLSAR